MNKKTLVGAAVVVVLAALGYLFGPDVVSMVKDSVGAAPVESSTTVDSDQ